MSKTLSGHPLRLSLHNEIHARPPEAMQAPLAMSHLVMACSPAQQRASRDHLVSLLRMHQLPQPDHATTHVRMDLPGFRLRWELHTEFVTWTFSRPLQRPGPGAQDLAAGVEAVPSSWLAALPGQMLAALNLWVLEPGASGGPPEPVPMLNPQTMVGSVVAAGRARVYTDFLLHSDGFARAVVQVDAQETSHRPRRWLGRLVQQLLEIDTYRMAALMGLPAARETSAALATAECELAELALAIRDAKGHDEPALLDRLSRLAGQVESQYAATHSRFSASAAYFELVERRICDMGEAKLGELQTLGEFVHRRLSPARTTCEWAVRRQDALSQRVSRVSSLLRTRVDIGQQQSSRALLATMTHRQGLQLQLQATVEGLSVAAITYYLVGLGSYLAKGMQQLGWPFTAESTAAWSVPLIAVAVWAFLRSRHEKLLAA